MNNIETIKQLNTSRCFSKEDARLRVLLARVGSFNNPSQRYLIELRKQLMSWIEAIDLELSRLSNIPDDIA